MQKRKLSYTRLAWYPPLRLFLLACLSFVLVFFVLPRIVLSIPAVQQRIGHIVADGLREKLGVPVSIRAIGLSWSGDLILEELTILDKQRKTMLSAQYAELGLHMIRSLRTKTISVASAYLYDPYLNIYYLTTGQLNIHPLVNAFGSGGKHKQTVNLEINTFLLRGGRLHYSSNGNRKRFLLSDLNTKIRLFSLRPNLVRGELRSLSFREQGGFLLKSLSTSFILRDNNLSCPALIFRSSGSSLSLKSVNLSFPEDGKQKFPSFRFRIDERSYLTLADFTSFYPPLGQLSERIDIAGSVASDATGIRIPSFRIQSGQGMSIDIKDLKWPNAQTWLQQTKANARTLNLNLSFDKLNVKADAAYLRDLSSLLPPELVIPNTLQRLRNLDLQMQFKGKGSDRRLLADLGTSAGSIHLDLGIRQGEALIYPAAITGNISCSRLQPNVFSSKFELISSLSADFSLNLESAPRQKNAIPLTGKISGSVHDLHSRGKTFDKILLDIILNPGGSVTGNLSFHHAAEQLTLQAHYASNSEIRRMIDFDLRCTDFALSRIPFFSNTYSGCLSGHLSGNFANLGKIDEIEGSATGESISVSDGKKPSLQLNRIEVTAKRHTAQGRCIDIKSDLADASLSGSFRLADLPRSVLTSFRRYWPAYRKKTNQDTETDSEDYRFAVVLYPSIEPWLNHFNLAVRLPHPLSLSGRYTANNEIEALVSGKEIGYGVNTLHQWQLGFNGSTGRANLLFTADVGNNRGIFARRVSLQAIARNDSIRVEADLGTQDNGERNGNVRTLINFEQTASTTRTRLHLLPSTLSIDRQVWQIEPAEVDFLPEQMKIRGFRLCAPGRYLSIDGTLSRLPGDSLCVTLDRFNLPYALGLAGVDFDLLNADLSGRITLGDLGNKQNMTAYLHAPSLKVNAVHVGAIEAFGHWNKDLQRIDMDAVVKSRSGGESSSTKVTGFFVPVGEESGLDLQFEASHLPIDFIGPFLDGFAHRFSGAASGNIRLFGPYAHLRLTGEARTENLRIGIKHLNTIYTLNGTSSFGNRGNRYVMQFHDMDVTDDGGHTACFAGDVSYLPGFDDFSYDVAMSKINGLLVYNLPPAADMPFGGRAYANGNARLWDNAGVNIETNLTTMPGTNIVLDFSHASVDNTGSNLLVFTPFLHPAESMPSPIDTLSKQKGTNLTDIPLKFSMQLTTTPAAKVRILFDAGSDDGITGRAEGNVRIELNESDRIPNIFGRLDLVSGSYDLTLEQIIRKQFILKSGGSILFAGNPMTANINLTGAYRLTANLGNLSEAFAIGQGRSNIPVECLLNLNGSLGKPRVDFDVKLPGADGELERRVRSYILGEGQMSRQIASLILLGRFYTVRPEERNGGSGMGNIASIATSTLSEQLSYLLGGMSDHFRLGTNIKTGNAAFRDTDIEVQLSGNLFNNRLLFNSNFGYRSNPLMRNTYVGEFDLEYLLTPGGTVRLKAYNHHNNMYQYLRQSLSTQGAGIELRKDFNTLSDIFPFLRFRRKASIDSTRIDR